MDRGGGHGALPHGRTDLIEAADEIADCVQPADPGLHLLIDHEPLIVVGVDAQHFGER